MFRKYLVIVPASLLLVLGVLLTSGFFFSTAHAQSRISAVKNLSATDKCPTLREYDGYDGSKKTRHYVAILQVRLYKYIDTYNNNAKKQTPPLLPINVNLGDGGTVADGYFGPKTLSLVKAVQKAAFGESGADGIVGKKTWRVLGDSNRENDPHNCTVPSDRVLPQGL